MIELPFPDKILWPNGRGHRMKKNRLFQKHKEWARLATLAAVPGYRPEGRVRLLVTIYPKTAHEIDKDNASAAMKAYQDGIALALKVNDSVFDLPTIQFAEPVKGGKIVVSLLP